MYIIIFNIIIYNKLIELYLDRENGGILSRNYQMPMYNNN